MNKKIKLIFEQEDKRFGYVIDLEDKSYKASDLDAAGEAKPGCDSRVIKDKRLLAQQLYMVLLSGLERG